MPYKRTKQSARKTRSNLRAAAHQAKLAIIALSNSVPSQPLKSGISNPAEDKTATSNPTPVDDDDVLDILGDLSDFE